MTNIMIFANVSYKFSTHNIDDDLIKINILNSMQE